MTNGTQPEFEERVLGAVDRDLVRRPGCIKPLTQDLVDRVARITAEVQVDRDAPLDGDVAL